MSAIYKCEMIEYGSHRLYSWETLPKSPSNTTLSLRPVLYLRNFVLPMCDRARSECPWLEKNRRDDKNQAGLANAANKMHRHLLQRADSMSPSHGLGLGWLLAIALGGGILLFTAVGFLLAWWIRSRAQPQSTNGNVYAAYPETQELPQSSTNRLIKRRLLGSETSLSRLSSQWSLTRTSVLPPLPMYHSFNFLPGAIPRGGRRARAKTWVNGDEFHAPKVQQSERDRWFRRDSWFGRVPTLPSLSAVDHGESEAERAAAAAAAAERDGAAQECYQRQQAPQQRQLQQSQTTPSFGSSDKDSNGMEEVKLPGKARVRPSTTDYNLRDILQHTEQRLRDGTVGSPTKTPRESPTKTSPYKTPRSHRTAPSTSSSRMARATPSPSKKATPQTGGSAKASINSIGSAANSLIAEATRELNVVTDLSSMKTMRRSVTKETISQSTEDGPREQRRRSVDSDVSSSLSTLYSEGEPDDQGSRAAAIRRDLLTMPSDGRKFSWESQRRVPTSNIAIRKSSTVATEIFDPRRHPSALPGPLRPISGNNIGSLAGTQLLKCPRDDSTLQLPKPRDAERVDDSDAVDRNASDSSMVTESVHTESDDSQLPTPKAEEHELRSHEDATRQNPPLAYRTAIRSSDEASSTSDEENIMSVLLSTEVPKRALPIPPSFGISPSGVPVPVGPSPHNKSNVRLTIRRASSGSDSSSMYDHPEAIRDPGAVTTGSPIRRSTVRSINGTQAVGSTIAELRRMNSLISSYSVTSMASTVFGDLDSPNLPSLRGGGFAPHRSDTKTCVAGSRNYLNIGAPAATTATAAVTATAKGVKARESPSSRKKKGADKTATKNSPSGTRNGEQAAASTSSQRTDRRNENESRGLGLRVPGVQSTLELQAARKEMPAATAAVTTSRAHKMKKLGPVQEIVAEEARMLESKRKSAGSPGLYDKDGFLCASPDPAKWMRA